MKPLDLGRFLSEQGLTPAMLARYLRVSQAYLETALAGEGALGDRDQAACLALEGRLARARHAQRAVQIELPFGQAPETFTRAYARQQARERTATQGRPPRRRDSSDPTRSP
jgi:hypothetical protein